MDFKAATDALLECGVTVAEIAAEAGVSSGTILRARMQSGQRRSPPKGWPAVLNRITWRRMAQIRETANAHTNTLVALAAELADA